MNARTKFASAVVLSSFLAACGSTPKAPAEPIAMAAQDKIFTVSNEFGALSFDEIALALGTNIKTNSKYQEYGAKRLADSSRSDTYTVGLTTVPQDGENLRVRYLYSVTGDLGTISSYHQALFNVSLKQESGYQAVTVRTPYEMTRVDKSFMFIPVNQLDTTENLVNDLANVVSKLDFSIDKTVRFQAELPTDYSVEAVIHSINRKYPVSNVKGGAESRTFSFNVDGTSITAKISPFRNGSILDYNYELPYTLKSDGTTSQNQQQLTALSEQLKKHIGAAI